MRTAVIYIPYDTSSEEQTGDIITFTPFEEEGLLSETCEDEESGDESDNNSIMPTLISGEEIDMMAYGDESDDEPIFTEMLEDIRDGSQYNPSDNRR